MSVVRRKDGSDDQARDPLALSLGQIEGAGLTTAFQEERVHAGRHVSVTSQLAIGIDQKIFLNWTFPERYRRKGYRLIGCRKIGGFAPAQARPDPDGHGQRIIDSRTTDGKEEHLPEGEYFYTFLLQRSVLGLMTITADVVQFSEAIPSADHAIKRLEQNIQARKLVQTLVELATPKERTRTGGPSGADIVAILAEQQREIDALKASEGFPSISEEEQKFAVSAVKAKYRKKMAGQDE